VFRANGEGYFFLKLGGKTRDDFYNEVGAIADIARGCQEQGANDPSDFRAFVNPEVALYLKRKRLLSAAREALPVLSALLGTVVSIDDLV
jgi:hypothetical protein